MVAGTAPLRRVKKQAAPKACLLQRPGLAHSMAAIPADDGTSVVLVEQNVRAALRIADRAYFMRSGEIILEQDSADALARGSWWDLF